MRRAALVERRRMEMTATKSRAARACRGKTGASGFCRSDRAGKNRERGADREARFLPRLVGATVWLVARFWSTRLEAEKMLWRWNLDAARRGGCGHSPVQY